MQTYLESHTFSHSKQKIKGKLYGIGADIHFDDTEIRFAYEYGRTDTKQPPLTRDLKVQKFFFLYNHTLNKQFDINLNYLSMLDDNIAITNGGDTFGAGVSYRPSKQWYTNFTQFYTNYNDFNVYQSNLTLNYKIKLGAYKIKLTSENFYINIDDKKQNSFTKNAQKEYFSSALKLHTHYNDWHFGAAAFFGRRAFAVMNDGFKLQHHAMEFDRTYAAGVGKNIGNAVIRVQFIYQRATELPLQNKDVEVRNIRLLLNYKF